jgi:hypothetical protein
MSSVAEPQLHLEHVRVRVQTVRAPSVRACLRVCVSECVCEATVW